jgi:hypothetical protein
MISSLRHHVRQRLAVPLLETMRSRILTLLHGPWPAPFRPPGLQPWPAGEKGISSLSTRLISIVLPEIHHHSPAELLKRGRSIAPSGLQQNQGRESSVLLKASFETSTPLWSEAVIQGLFEDLGSPARGIVVVKSRKSGAGGFNVGALRHI